MSGPFEAPRAAILLLVGVFASACDPPGASDRGARRNGLADVDGGSSGAEVDPGPVGGPSCANGVRDGDETDIDCGGAICPACANGRTCAIARDCASLVCGAAKCTNDIGCSDGTREAFAAVATFPNIAACAGGWSLAGLGTPTTSPACARVSGNSSANPTGAGCNVVDLCQPGWHVCETPAAVATKSGGAGCAAAAVAGQNAFFVTGQSGGGGAACGVGNDDLFGCGDVGLPSDPATCAPLDRFSNDLCAALPATWACGPTSADERNNVTKTASEGGGVLCCRD